MNAVSHDAMLREALDSAYLSGQAYQFRVRHLGIGHCPDRLAHEKIHRAGTVQEASS